MLGSDETREYNYHASEGGSLFHNSPRPFPQSQYSPPSPPPFHPSMFFCVYHNFQTIGILPTNILQEIKPV